MYFTGKIAEDLKIFILAGFFVFFFSSLEYRTLDTMDYNSQ